MPLRRSESILHTEWKSVEDPRVLLNMFTQKFGQHFRDD